ncbi:MAG: DUF302 domain-containing protein [Minicystis sp.]
MNRGTWKELKGGFDAALARLPAALQAEGFGIITQIDLQQTFKAKLGVDFRRYRILGACNPTLAHAAVQRDPGIGLLLPCNLVLYERDDGSAALGAIDPVETIGAGEAFADLARDVRARLGRVLEAIE